jgi:hypothetical protein
MPGRLPSASIMKLILLLFAPDCRSTPLMLVLYGLGLPCNCPCGQDPDQEQHSRQQSPWQPHLSDAISINCCTFCTTCNPILHSSVLLIPGSFADSAVLASNQCLQRPAPDATDKAQCNTGPWPVTPSRCRQHTMRCCSGGEDAGRYA